MNYINTVPEKDALFVCSWSGGKDSCLALHYALANGSNPMALLSMLDETGQRSRSHGLPVNLLKHQAASMNIALETRCASWGDYETVFVDALRMLRDRGATAGIFGDIDIEDHLKWEEMVCAKAGIDAFLPLWQRSRIDLLEEFFSFGYQAIIVATQEAELGRKYLGKNLCPELVEEFEHLGIDPSGENGEYHTVVFDGPIFQHTVKIEPKNAALSSGYWFLDL